MIFYIVMGSLFGIYGLDLLALVVISAIARAHEVKAAMGLRKLERKQSKAAEKAAKEAAKEAGEKKGVEAPPPDLHALAPDGAPPLPLIKFHSTAAAMANSTPSAGTTLPRSGSCMSLRCGNPSPLPGLSAEDASSGCSTPTTPLATMEPEPQCMLPPNRRIAHIESDSNSSEVGSHEASPGDLQLSNFGVKKQGELDSGLASKDGGADDQGACAGEAERDHGKAQSLAVTAVNPVCHTEILAGAENAATAAVIDKAHCSDSNASETDSHLTHARHSRNNSVSESAGDSEHTSGTTLPWQGRPPLSPGGPFPPSPPNFRPSPRGPGCRGSAGSSTGSLARSGGSGMSLPSSGGSGISADIVIAAEILRPGGMGASQLKEGGGKPLIREGSLPKGDFTKDRTIMETDSEPEWPRPVEEYPLVLIQLPMYNEEAHCGLIVERSCEIAWPRSRVLVQVCDDSTKAHIRDKVDVAAAACMEKGHLVQVLRRTNRQGYKAGAMVEGLENVAPLGYKYCAIFDADFEPPKDFLLETIGPLEADPTLGFVQTRWLCPYNSFLTWAQNVNLGFHFDVEQRARSFMRWFFNFNGTAGVWRIETINDAGGWQSDTVVEDMDLSLRAYLAGWKGIYLPHVGCPNEVPDDLSTYKTQQYRWLCGPMQILSKAFWHIWNAKHVPLRLRLNCYWFFARYVLFALITLAVLSVPPVALWLDPWEWQWPQIFLCVTVNFALAVYLYITPWSIAFLLFSVATGYFKAWAMLGGLIGSKKSKSWKVRAAHSLAFGGVGLSGPSWLMGAYCSLMAVIFLALSFGDSFL
ncbi:nucleotide-diphospho-sugar transferase [Haematococcus lacustris]